MDPSQIDVITVWNYVATHQWLPLLVLCVGMVTRLLKDDTVLPTIPKRYRAWAALGMGLLGSGLEAVVHGTPWAQALLHGLAAGMAAVLADNFLVKPLLGDVPLPKSLLHPAEPPDSPDGASK